MLCQYLATLDEKETDYDDRAFAYYIKEMVISLTSGPSDNKEKDEVDKNKLALIAIIEADYAPTSFSAKLQTTSVFYILTQQTYLKFQNEFDGVMIDSGASRGTTCPMAQYLAF